ncbi:MAG: sulfite exporter TauE/SafE family protein [Candidatus Eisenbacteria bacterium]|nr:sulfite exporter TauE/SafE family protein [Candidatus Eisenbacteria bacterium]
MTPSGERWRGILTGLAAGLAGGLFGVGGGIVLVPMLTGLFSLTQHEAHGTSLAAVGATAVAGLIVYAAGGHVAWVIGAIMAVTSVLCARLGARLAARTSRVALTRAFAVLLAIVAARLFWRTPMHTGAPLLAGVAGALVAMLVGAAVGLLSGFMGVGGGLLAVPALALLFGAPQQTAQGTSLALILATAPVGAIEHHRHGNVVPRLVPWLALGAIVGAPLASALALRLPQAVLARAFAVFLLANAVQTWARVARARG